MRPLCVPYASLMRPLRAPWASLARPLIPRGIPCAPYASPMRPLCVPPRVPYAFPMRSPARPLCVPYASCPAEYMIYGLRGAPTEGFNMFTTKTMSTAELFMVAAEFSCDTSANPCCRALCLVFKDLMNA